MLSGPTFGFTTQEFNIVGGYTENLEKPQNCQKLWVGACAGMGTCPGQYGICNLCAATVAMFTYVAAIMIQMPRYLAG